MSLLTRLQFNGSTLRTSHTRKNIYFKEQIITFIAATQTEIAYERQRECPKFWKTNLTYLFVIATATKILPCNGHKQTFYRKTDTNSLSYCVLLSRTKSY